MNHSDGPKEETIAAIAGGVGGAVSVVRLSGPDALAIGRTVWRGKGDLREIAERTLRVGRVVDAEGNPVDQCLVAFFCGPRSYTGEDMVEFHTHGGALAPRQVLRCLLQGGARLAEPGEFTKRAFINGKMDLTQAEAVGDLISAHTEMALHLANRQLQGALTQRIMPMYEQLLGVLAEVESRLDFPEEQLAWIPPAQLVEQVTDCVAAMQRLQLSRHTGEVLREGIRLVIAGCPNVGKSSLLNFILGRDRAIVTEIPGTTRDTLEELAHVRGIPVRVTDTAGIREAEDLVEQNGIARSKASLKEAQVILWLYEAAAGMPEDTWTTDLRAPVIYVANKVDRLADATVVLPPRHVAVSAKTGEGMETLYDRIEQVVWDRPRTSEPECAISARHASLLEMALAELDGSAELLEQEAWELAAVQVRGAVENLGRITGLTASVDVLETIFANFCIGK